MILQEISGRGRTSPLWWRIPVWAVLTAYSVTTAHGFGARIAGGLLMGGSAAALQVIQSSDRVVRVASQLIATATGLAACFFLPRGLPEIPVLVAAARIPSAFDGRAVRWFTVLDTLAFGVTIALIARSASGLLAGIGVPLLVQRSIEQRELMLERDRAQALLTEAQRTRESEAEAAALQERGRIAREMHDVLAHSLAGLSMQLQGVRALAGRQQLAEPLLGELDKAAALARDGLTEARAAVGALRDPVGLGVAELPALVERHPGATTLTTTGEPGSVTPAAGHAVYRAVQESLTNAARYAPGSLVAITLDWSDVLVVSVTDTGPGPGRTPVAGQGTGLGLAGMAERVTQADGSMQAGPRDGGGWATAITVPVTS